MSNPNLVDELEAAFQNCFAVLNTQEHFNAGVTNDSKTGAEQCLQGFLEKTREMEAFFLQRRVLLSVHRPEQLAKEDIQELKAELVRKENLLQQYYERLQHWPSILQDIPSQQQTPHLNISPGVAHHPGASPGVAGMNMGDVMTPSLTQSNSYPHGKGPLSYLEQSMSSIGMPERR